MLNETNIYVWQPLLTDHARFTLEALARHLDVKVTAVSEMCEDKVRAEQGWTNAPTHCISERVLTGWREVFLLSAKANACKEQVSIFWAPFWRPKLLFAMIIAIFSKSRVFLVSEPYPEEAVSYFGAQISLLDKLKVLIRPILYRLFICVLGRRIEGIFAISKLAALQFNRAGFPSERIHPFGYFIPTPRLVEKYRTPNPRSPSDSVSLVFVGSLIPRKGLDILIDAVREANKDGLYFTASYYGHGNPASFEFDNTNNVYRGALPFGTAGETMATYDVVVVPSRHDGWAVVVNEAIGAGVPIICSSAAGASTLIEKYGGGWTFDPNSKASLAAVLGSIHADPSVLKEMQERQGYAAVHIQPKVAAQYMGAILDTASGRSFPNSPWY